MAEEYERFLKQYEDRTDEKLQQIATDFDYTEEARKAAKDILGKRGIEVKEATHNSWKPLNLPNEKVFHNHDSYRGDDHSRSGSTVGEILKVVAWVQLGLAVLVSIIIMSNVGFVWVTIGLFSSFVACLMIYALGEICCLLADIRDNTNR